MLETFHKKDLAAKVLLVALFATLLFPLWDGQAHARNKFDEYQVKLAFLFNLTHFVTWPEESFSSPESPFVIAILGEDPFGTNLDGIVSNEKINGHPVVIQRIDSIRNLQTAHLLYIDPRIDKDTIRSILRTEKRPGLLTVSDYQGFTSAGGAANLLVKNNRLILELNTSTTKFNRLKFSSKLLQLATIVGDE